MNLEKFLNYATHHSESLIQWLFLGILLLSGILIARNLFGKKTPDPSGNSQSLTAMPDLQAALDKIMAQIGKLESAPLKEMSPAGVADVDAQVQALKKELASREEEINQLKAAGSSKAGEDASALSIRIKELESKLAEYEILEDDIADLSLYKEENTRLRAELEKVKGGAVVGAAAPTVTASPAVPSPAPQTGEAIVAEFAQAVSSEPATPKLDPVAEAASVSIPDTGNPMADFESTVELERSLASAPASAPAPTPAAIPAPMSAPTAAATPVAKSAAAAAPAAVMESSGEADDIFAEFASAPGSEEGESTLDTERMMAEMAALVSIEPAQGNALDESIDIDKMASEAKE